MLARLHINSLVKDKLVFQVFLVSPWKILVELFNLVAGSGVTSRS